MTREDTGGTRAQPERFVSLLTRDTLAVIMAGGRGARLGALTRRRAKPAVHFGGKFRLIDFPLSNCANSGVRRIGVLTQYRAQSLIRHLQLGWGFLRGQFGEFVEILPAQQQAGSASWYLGTADAVYQNLEFIRAQDPGHVLVLAGDHVYRMDYGRMIAYHVDQGADATVGCLEVARDEARSLGVIAADRDGRVSGFVEKPDSPPSLPDKADRALASMGIYVFDAEFLYDRLAADAVDDGSSHDFGRDVIPGIIGEHRVQAYRFVDPAGRQGYWRDVGTVDALWAANMELLGPDPELDLYDESWPIWTYQPQLPPAKFVFGEEGRRGVAVDSMVAGGCIVTGARVQHSLLFSSVRVGPSSRVVDSVVFPRVEIGEDCHVARAIVERGCVIPDGTTIGTDDEADRERFTVTPGGVRLVTREML